MDSIYSGNSLSYVLVLAMISLCKGINYDAQLAIKMKEMDMEYGEKLTSIEEARMTNKTVKVDGQKSGELQRLAQYISPTSKSKPSTRCTTEKPLPKLNPGFLPSSEDEKENDISFDYDKRITKRFKYEAPDMGNTQKFYVDDE